jgi:hypothetical protein
MDMEKANRWLAAMALVAALSAMGGIAGGKPYDEYPEWELLPKGIDIEDETLVANLERLKAQGESAHEAMWAVIRECNDLMPASAALSVLASTQDNQREVMEGLKQFIKERLFIATGDEEGLITDMAKVLADKGTEADMDALIPMLYHSNPRMCVVGAMYLGQRGGKTALDALTEARGRTSGVRVRREIDAAIARIENRLAKDPGSLGQGKSDAGETEDEEIVGQRPAIGGSTDGRD